MNNRINQIQGVLNNFIKIFQKNPLDYFYEEDIRAELFCLLKKNFFTDKLPQKISRVKAEYHYSRYCKVDIAILGELENLTPPFMTAEKIFELYKQKVEVAIEIKFQMIYTDQTRPFKEDCKKLEDLMKRENLIERIDSSIALLFFQLNEDFKKVEGLYKNYTAVQELKLIENSLNKIVISPAKVLFETSLKE